MQVRDETFDASVGDLGYFGADGRVNDMLQSFVKVGNLTGHDRKTGTFSPSEHKLVSYGQWQQYTQTNFDSRFVM
jgi:hypothetical protein